MAKTVIDWLRYIFWSRRSVALPVEVERRKSPYLNCKEAGKALNSSVDRLSRALGIGDKD